MPHNAVKAIVFVLCLLLFVALIFMAAAPHAIADQDHTKEGRKTVRIVSFSFPPILHYSEEGEFSGTMGETVKMLCEASELDCGFDVVPLKRAYDQLKSGTADALITINVGQLKDCCIPSEWSSPWTAGFFSSNGEGAIPTSEEELIGKKIITVIGMKSPYAFAKNLDQMSADDLVSVLKAPRILSAVKMFLSGRAPLLWGGEDFKWYIGKLDSDAQYVFKPLFKKPVVVWVRKDKPEILRRLNHAFSDLRKNGSLGDGNLLNPSLMKKHYVDAPLKK